MLRDGDLVLDLLGIGRELLQQILFGSHFLASICLHGSAAEPCAEDAQTVGALGIERVVDGLRRQRGHDELDVSLTLGTLTSRVTRAWPW